MDFKWLWGLEILVNTLSEEFGVVVLAHGEEFGMMETMVLDLV